MALIVQRATHLTLFAVSYIYIFSLCQTVCPYQQLTIHRLVTLCAVFNWLCFWFLKNHLNSISGNNNKNEKLANVEWHFSDFCGCDG